MGAGDWVQVLDAGGDAVGVGYYNPATTIAVRMVAFDAALQPEQIIRHRIERAIALRQRVIRGDTDCYRMVNGDGDGLSGVVVDRYGSVLVVQLLTAGADWMRGEIVAALRELVTPLAASALSIIERSHGAVRKQEGLADHSEVLAGTPPSETIAVEHGIRLAIDIDGGRRPARSSISVRIGRCCASWRAGHGCSTRTVTAAASVWRRLRARRALWSRSIRRNAHWRRPSATSILTAIAGRAPS